MGRNITAQAAFVAFLGALASAKLQRTNGPQMGYDLERGARRNAAEANHSGSGRWNTYNGYNCNPSENIVKTNAQALIDKGADKVGYIVVTPDCGWMSPERDNSQRLVWNPAKFPSGGKALGDWLHNKGLQFGLYSGAGTWDLSSEPSYIAFHY